MKNLTYTISALVGLFIMSACSNEETLVAETTVEEPSNKITVTATAGMPGDVPATRLYFEPTTTDIADGLEDILNLYWNENDSYVVFSGNSTASTLFEIDPTEITETSKTTTASFKGKVTEGEDYYYAVYPDCSRNSDGSIELSVGETTQGADSRQTGQLNSQYVYMYDVRSIKDNYLRFLFQHLTAVIAIKIRFPYEELQYSNELTGMGVGGSMGTSTRTIEGRDLLNLVVLADGLCLSETIKLNDDGTYSIESSTTTTGIRFSSPEQIYFGPEKGGNDIVGTAYLHLFPCNLTTFSVMASLSGDNNSQIVYQGGISFTDEDGNSVSSKEIKAGYYYTAEVNMARTN